MGIQQKFTGDVNQLMAEIEKLCKNIVKLEEQNAKTSKSSKEFHDQNKEGIREGVQLSKQLIRESETLDQKNQRLKESLKAAWQAGKISSTEYANSLLKVDAAANEAAKTTATVTGNLSGAITKVATFAAGFVSVSSAIGLVKSALADYNKQLDESLALSAEVAKAQSDAFKNMAGMATASKLGMLGQVAGISLDTGFSDVGKLTDAIGAGVSAGGGEILTMNAVKAAAKLTTNKPEQLGVFSAGAIDIGRGTGRTDAEGNLAFLLQAGAQARVVDPELLAKNLAPVVASVSSRAAPEKKEDVARESAAMFAVLSRAGTDVTGMSTTTAATQFMGRMESFFDDLMKTSADESPEKMQKEAVLRSDVIGLRPDATPFEQLRALQDSKKLNEAFFAESFGEERFKAAFKSLATSGTDLSKEILTAKNAITFDRAEYDRQAEEARSATPELFTSSAGGQLSAVNTQLKNDFPNAFKQVLRDKVAENLSLTRSGGGGYMRDYMEEFFQDAPILSAGTPEESIQAAKGAVQFRLNRLRSDRAEAAEYGGSNEATKSEIGAAAMLTALEKIEAELKKQNYSNDALQKWLEKQNAGPTPNVRNQTRNQEGLGGVDQ